MTNRAIQGFFLNRQARVPAPFAHPRPKVAQPYGGNSAFEVDPTRLGLANGGGRSLPDAVRGKMEAAFAADFSAVRVHVGPQAERIGAIAFTLGADIYFAPGRYQPDSVHGQQLLGHELAHVIQQRQGRVRASGSGVTVVQDRALEAEADHLAQRAVAHARPSGAALQLKDRAQSLLHITTQPVGSVVPDVARRQVAWAGNRTVQAKGGKQLLALAAPRTFKGPEMAVQQALVKELEKLVAEGTFGRGDAAQSIMCLGGVLLPNDLDMLPADLIRAASFVKAPNPAVRDAFDVIAGRTYKI
jgi:hypothetical protein